MDQDWQPATGSAPYYTARFSPLPARQKVVLVFLWQTLLRDILARATDPGVSRLKLDWWRQELEQAHAGEPRHPIAQRLQPLLADANAKTACEVMLSATDRELGHLEVPAAEDWYQHCADWGGSLSRLLLIATNADNPDKEILTNCGRFIEAVDRIIHIPHHNPRLAIYLPRINGLYPGDIRSNGQQKYDQQQITDYAQALLAPVIEPAKTSLTRIHDPASRPLKILTTLILAQYRKLVDKGFAIDEPDIELLPISRLWVAWRCSRS